MSQEQISASYGGEKYLNITTKFSQKPSYESDLQTVIRF
jgi:hypothetical protein